MSDVIEVRFLPTTDFPPGTVLDLLERSYDSLLREEPRYWGPERESFAAFDKEVYDHPATVGACVLVTAIPAVTASGANGIAGTGNRGASSDGTGARADAAVAAAAAAAGVTRWRAIGLGTWDPRQGPAVGIVGHNCVIPDYQGQGIGRRQVQEILRRFRQRGFARAAVTTSEHPFFVPAQRMYAACGFTLVGRRSGGPDPRYGVLDFALPF